MLNSENIVDIKANNITYKLFLPGKDLDYIQKTIFESKAPYEYEMLIDIINKTNENDLILDIGSNIGNHTIFLAMNNRNVYSFEANKDLFDILQKSIEINNCFDKVKSYNLGISDKISKANFKNFNASNLGSQSLDINDNGDINLVPLDSIEFHKKVSAIKIDVEGMEINVLEGAKNIILKDRPLLYIEAINNAEFKKQLKQLKQLKYTYIDTFNATPTHLFIPSEMLTEKEIISDIFNYQVAESYRTTRLLNDNKRLQQSLINLENSFSSNTKLLLDKLSNRDNELIAKYKKQAIEIEQSNLSNLESSLLSNMKNILEEFSNRDNNSVVETEKYKKKILELEQKNKILDFELRKKDLEIQKVKKTWSFRLGNRLIKSTKSFKSFITLPYDLYIDYKDFKGYRNSSTKKIDKIPSKPIIKRIITKKKIDINNFKDLRVAVIMDEFTYNSFKYECNLLQLSFDNWENEIKDFKPDLLFIESAWKGKDDSWATKISNCSAELVNLVKWCNSQKIPTMFWNKEDPVHFDTFIPVAQIVDYVFTTDIDCVPYYKDKVGHNEVYLLPFAAQPFVHNPIEKYHREDKFSFAGSYYLRYPERQRDFATLIDATKDFKTVEIYDRNFDNPHPHYTFPDEYKPMILGKLPFEEIDKAYKGYKFGINMNTIKQSQSMFARRVFELMASNTIVVSNFSRGVRNFFGDLVICSDDKDQIKKQISPYCQDEILYKKFRLLGLRKVMSEHTYADRFEYICDKIFEYNKANIKNKVIIFSIVNSCKDFKYIAKSFTKQNYVHKELCIIKNFSDQIAQDGIKIFDNENEFIQYIESLENKKNIFIGHMNSQDYYGASYLEDLILSIKYSNADVFGKASYYRFESDNIALQNANMEYNKTNKLDFDSSILRLSTFSGSDIDNLIKDKTIKFDNMLGIDSFNYCQNGRQADEKLLQKYIDNLNILDTGVDIVKKAHIVHNNQSCQKRAIENGSIKQIDASSIFLYLNKNITSKINLSLSNDKILIKSNLSYAQHSYIYLDKVFSREELNLVTNSRIQFIAKANIEDARCVFEFQDINGLKISHSMGNISDALTLAIPNECRYIRIGFKITGKGEVEISNLILGKVDYYPNLLMGKSKKLVLTKQYPSYTDIYKYGFLHTRVKAYKENNNLVDIFRISKEPDILYREFEGVDISCGDAKLLEETLSSGQYDHVLVHLVDTYMWSVLEKFIDKIKVTIWVHGAEIDTWDKRAYNFKDMSEEEIARQKKLSDARVKFWKSILSKKYPNLHLVFVSEYLKNDSLAGIGIDLDKESYSIVHNYIDTKLFEYQKKDSNFRKKIFSVRPYHSHRYANDTAAEAIKILSKKEFFEDLEFCLIGDGKLFDIITEPLREYQNVKLEKRFLLQSQIAQYHKKYGIFLVPTRGDSQGVSRDEAMASGLVPVTTRTSAVPEFVDENCGILAEPESPEELANAIEYLYKNPDEFTKLSYNAYKRVSTQCSFENTIARELRIINE